MRIDNKSVITNFIWRFAERCGAQGVTLIVSIVLARLLVPEAYGKIALITVFTTILNVFVDSGLGNALIQKKDADELDFSTVFICNIIFCIVLYLAMFFAAPIISDFYGDMSLVPVIRVLSITILISGLKNVQQAYVSRTMQFKKFFISTLGGTIGAAVLGITIAYLGGGIWALVAQQVFNITVDTIILWITVKWRPQRRFSFERLKGLFSYGWKLLVSSLIDTLYNNARSLIIGKIYSSSDLAYYNQGKKLPELIASNVNTSIDSVLLPTMSNVQDNRERVKAMTRRAIKTSTYIMAPLMMGLAFCSRNIVMLVLTEKWLPCMPFLVVFCINYMFFPIHTANLNAIKAMGRSDMFLKLEIIKKIVGFIVLFSTMWFGVWVMALSSLGVSLMSQVINSWPNRKLLNYGYLEQLKDILPSIIAALIMGAGVLMIEFLGLPSVICLIVQIICGAIIYLFISIVFKFEAFIYLLDIIKSLVFKNK